MNLLKSGFIASVSPEVLKSDANVHVGSSLVFPGLSFLEQSNTLLEGLLNI